MIEFPMTEIMVAFWGVFISLLQERFGKFQDLAPRTKQVVNAITAFVVPAIAIWWVNPWWQTNWGDSEEFTAALITLVAPAFVWALSQLTHLVESSAEAYKSSAK